MLTRCSARCLRVSIKLTSIQKAGFFTYGPPRYRQSLPAKMATFGIMAAVISAPQFICTKYIPVWATRPRDEYTNSYTEIMLKIH